MAIKYAITYPSSVHSLHDDQSVNDAIYIKVKSAWEHYKSMPPKCLQRFDVLDKKHHITPVQSTRQEKCQWRYINTKYSA
eukprot:6754724-Ditylum_brightwellii.AAC.1